MPRVKKDDTLSGSINPAGNVKLQEKIIENLVELQKVHTNMAERFDKLSNNITNLLTLFEMAARSFAEHPSNIGTDKDKEFLEKIDLLLAQNKTIAKGLTLMEERVREKVYGVPQVPQAPPGLEQANPINSEEYEYSTANKQSDQPTRPLPKF